MLRVNLLQPKLEPTAIPGTFILPFYREAGRFIRGFMVLKVSRTWGLEPRYSLSKSIVFQKHN